MPTTTIDTFFACTIIVAVALIATAFVGSSLIARIDATHNANENVYLQSIADHIVTNCGTPTNWGTSSQIPQDFGLAASNSTVPYEVDADKICMLSTLSTFNLAASAKLSNIALGISVSQILQISLQQPQTQTEAENTTYTFPVQTSINSKLSSASLHCYVLADGFQSDNYYNTSTDGSGSINLQIPTDKTGGAVLLVFARAGFDDRLTSFMVYDFASATQMETPQNQVLNLSAIGYTLTVSSNASGVSVQNVYLFSFATQQNLTETSESQFAVPEIIDNSPFILVVCGENGSVYFQDWTAYPLVPLNAGSNFTNSERNIFSYTVTIKGVLYKLAVSLGGTPK
ncbi:MAG: hypothetical protein NWF01_03265 [Candidatus Bathyarchaeota archaeon]|nr:hypothetical protein [Candidatus Bathyarchaeota archaeon]